MVEFFNKLGSAFGDLGSFLLSPAGYFVVFIFLLALAFFITGRHFRKIITKEMKLRGIEYGEIASAKVLHNTGIIIILSIMSMLGVLAFLTYLIITSMRG